MPITLPKLYSMKEAGEKSTCLTVYDSTQAMLAENAGIDILLVGDSLGMTCQGLNRTVPVTMEHMLYHTHCVATNIKEALIMADMPFNGASTPDIALSNSARLMQSGANLVKIEGGDWLIPTVQNLSERGIPTCVHLGLTPQSVDILGGYKVQGSNLDHAQKMITTAINFEKAGASLLLLECVPSPLALEITQSVKIPVIGIGAGAHTDCQVLIIYDMLGMTQPPIPKFVKNFMVDAKSPLEAIRDYVNEVKSSKFPKPEHCFGLNQKSQQSSPSLSVLNNSKPPQEKTLINNKKTKVTAIENEYN